MLNKVNTLATLLLILSFNTPALSDHHAGVTGYGISNNGKTLIVMPDLAKPSEMKKYNLSNPVWAIAYRPVTGDLLGFANGKLYKINKSSGEITDLQAKFMENTKISDDAKIGFDFNNKIDAVRVVSSKGDNLVYFPVGFGGNSPKSNTVRRFTNLAYDKGDKNEGAKPKIFANAYTNAINGKKAGSTFQYAIDANTNALVSLANNAGTLKTIGTIKIKGKPADIIAMGGFDITSHTEGKNQAYAILQLNGEDKASLYAINLKSAEATPIAKLDKGSFMSFAVSKAK